MAPAKKTTKATKKKVKKTSTKTAKKKVTKAVKKTSKTAVTNTNDSEPKASASVAKKTARKKTIAVKPMGKKDLEYFRGLLLEKRMELILPFL